MHPLSRRRTSGMRTGICASSFFLALFFLLAAFRSDARMLTFLSDRVSTSAPGAGADHTITFRTTTAVPPSGKIVIIPQSGFFVVTSTLNYLDADLATSSALMGTYVDRQLAATAGTSTDGVIVVPGTSGSISFTLSSAAGIAAGTYVRIKIGLNAVFGGAGANQITHPSSIGSYSILVRTTDAGGAILDYMNTLIAIVSPVNMEANTIRKIPPALSNLLPSGTLPAGTQAAEISLNTDVVATCRFATSSGVIYDAMTNSFTATSTFHFANVYGLFDNGTFNYYIRCADQLGNKNTSDTVLSFTTAPTPPPPGTGGGGGGNSGGGGGGGGGGSGNGAQFPPAPAGPIFNISGRSYPFATLTLLKDGQVWGTFKADPQGFFSSQILGLTVGTYTFTIYAQDLNGARSSNQSLTLSLFSAAQNSVSGIFPSPTVRIATSTIPIGGTVLFSGYSIPSSTVELLINKQSDLPVPLSQIAKTTATTDSSGFWQLAFDTTGLSKATYEAKADGILAGFGVSNYSNSAYFGVGMAPAPKVYRKGDLNKDGRVNLVDFSILLFYWGTGNPVADINLDGKVNLTDFSIMLFNWTG